MLNISLAQLKADITPKLKGTSIRQVGDFFSTAAGAANRMLARIDPEETRRTTVISTPFYDNLNDYPIATDYKRMIDIRPQANRRDLLGRSHFSQTTPRQFSEQLQSNSFSIGWNSMIRTLRSQRLPGGNVSILDTFDGPTGNGSWGVTGQASGLYTENLNFVQGSSCLGFNLSATGGAAGIVNSTAPVTDLSALLYNDASMVFVYIPVGFSARFTSFALTRGSSASAYKKATVTTKADGTAFNDGWNFLLMPWNTATTTGSPDNTKNTYRAVDIVYTAGIAIPGVLVDGWTNSLGSLYEMEYYSEYMFRTAAGIWIQKPTLDTDLVNVGPASYEILKTEMMIDITQEIRIGNIRNTELADWRVMLNGQPPNRYVKDPQYRGLYADYVSKFASSAISTITETYDFDV